MTIPEQVQNDYKRWHQSAGWNVLRCLAGDCSHGMSAILGGTGSAVWHLAE